MVAKTRNLPSIVVTMAHFDVLAAGSSRDPYVMCTGDVGSGGGRCGGHRLVAERGERGGNSPDHRGDRGGRG